MTKQGEKIKSPAKTIKRELTKCELRLVSGITVEEEQSIEVDLE